LISSQSTETKIINLTTENLSDADETEKLRNSTEPSLARAISNPLDSVCAICMATFRVDDIVVWSLRLTSCKHVYHTSCLREWFRTSNRYECAYCRGDFRGPIDGTLLTINGVVNQVGTLNEIDDDDDRGEVVHTSQIRQWGRFCTRHGLILYSE